MIVNEATKNANATDVTIVPEGVNEEAGVVMLLQDGKDEHDDDEDEDNTDSNRVDSDTPSPARGRAVGTFIDRKTFLTFRVNQPREKVIAEGIFLESFVHTRRY